MRAALTVAAAVAAAAILPGCLEADPGLPAAGAPPESGGNETGGVSNIYRVLAEGQYSGITEPTRRVVESETEWQALWAEHTSSESDPPPAPEVRWEKTRVVAVFLGEKPDTCWHVRFAGFDARDPGKLVVNVTTYSPSEGMGCGDAVTTPFVIGAFPDHGARVEYRDAHVEGAPPTQEEPPQPYLPRQPWPRECPGGAEDCSVEVWNVTVDASAANATWRVLVPLAVPMDDVAYDTSEAAIAARLAAWAENLTVSGNATTRLVETEHGHAVLVEGEGDAEARSEIRWGIGRGLVAEDYLHARWTTTPRVDGLREVVMSAEGNATRVTLAYAAASKHCGRSAFAESEAPEGWARVAARGSTECA